MREKNRVLGLLFLLAMFALTGCEKEEIRIGGAEAAGQEETAVPEEEPEKDREEEKEDPEEEKEDKEVLPAIWVDVSGAVTQPGVYELEADARVFQAIEAAGGLTEEADAQWLNQAAEVADGEKIVVYTKAETQEMKEQGISAQQEEAGEENQEPKKININQASLEELQEIPGIGEVRAQAILDYREEAGGFGSIEDIQQVSGIKGKTFEKIEAYITVE